MDIIQIKNSLDVQYYKSLISTLNKKDISYEWLNEQLNRLQSNETDTDIKQKTEESDTKSQIFSDEEFYKKPWNKLNPIHKILKIKEYVNTLENISLKDKNELKDHLTDLVKTKVLSKKEKINYDAVNGKIVSLLNLQYKDGKYTYMIE